MPVGACMRLPASLRSGLYLTGVAVLASGVVWLMVHDAARPERVDAAAMEIHGGSAMVLLVLIGAASALHAPAAWREGKNRWSGATLAAALTLLVLTGFLLYYLGDERARSVVSMVHWTVGLAAAALLGVHVWLGLRAAKAANCARPRSPAASARARSSP